MGVSTSQSYPPSKLARVLRRISAKLLRSPASDDRLLIEASLDGVIIVEHGRVRDANGAAAAMFGYAQGEILGMPLAALVPGADAAVEWLSSSGTMPCDITGRMKDGSPIPIEALGKTLRVGSQTLLALTLRDVTGRNLAEAALRSSEERFRQLAEHIGEVFWLTPPGLDQVIYVSPAYEQVWGQSCASLYDRPQALLDSVYAPDRERVAAHLGASPEPSVEEYRIRRPDGQTRWIGSRAFPIRDQAGCVYRVAVLAQDITERRQVDAALKESAATIRALYDIAASQHLPFERRVEDLLAMGCARFGLPTGVLSRIADGQFHVLAARTPDGSLRAGDTFALGDTYCSITTQQSEPLSITHMGASQWVTHPCYSVFNLEAYFGTTVLVHGKPYGTLCFSSPDPRALPFSEADTDVLRLMAQWVSGEIERRQAEETLEQQYREAERARGEARAVLDATSDGVLLVSSTGQLLSVNRRVNELFGIPADALVGRPAADLHASIRHTIDDSGALFARLSDLASDDAQPEADIVVQRAPVRRELAVFSAPVWSARQTLLGRLFVFRDVTHERAVDRMKSEFVSLVSHELRTPLTSIKGYVDLLLEGAVGPPLDAEQHELLSIVKESASQLVAIVNDLLDAARIESGNLEVRLVPLDVKAVLVGVANMLRPQIAAKRQELQLTLPGDLPLAHGDAPRVAQIATNLLSNAHKYTPRGGRISVSVQHEGAWVRVAVQDTGIGLSSDEQAQIFKRFFRASNRSTREAGGTGLGLAITRSLVELHGGTIDVASAPGEGATFRFTLPVAPATEESLDA